MAEVTSQDKKIWGETENAVRMQIYAEITAHCMMAIVQNKMEIKPSFYDMLSIASISLLDITPLRELFGEPNNNIVKEQVGSNEPSLF